MAALIYYLALTGSCLGTLFLLPVLVGFGIGETQAASNLLTYNLLGIFVFFSLLISRRGQPIELDRVSSIYLVVLAWALFPFLVALPIKDLFAISYSDAVFEAISGFTTTAAEGTKNPDAAPRTAIFLRATVQWAGGLATLLTFILFLGPIRAGGLPKPRTSSGEATGRSSTGINRTAWQMLRAWLFLTIFCFAALMLAGIDGFSAAILASTAMSSGGYLPANSDLITIAGPAGLVVLALFLIVSSTSVFWHKMIAERRLEQLQSHRESHVLIIAAVVLFAVFFLAIANASGALLAKTIVPLASEALFNAASLVSTSGLQSRPGVFALLAPVLIMAILFIGGGCYSTAGGIKLYRIGGMLFHASAELSKLVYPSGVTRSHIGSESYGSDLMKSIWTMFVAAMITIIASSGLLAFTGMSYGASLMASIAAFANAGPAYSGDWVARGTPGWPPWSEMAIGQKSVLAATMLAGRLEVIALVAALNPFYWIRR